MCTLLLLSIIAGILGSFTINLSEMLDGHNFNIRKICINLTGGAIVAPFIILAIQAKISKQPDFSLVLSVAFCSGILWPNFISYLKQSNIIHKFFGIIGIDMPLPDKSKTSNRVKIFNFRIYIMALFSLFCASVFQYLHIHDSKDIDIVDIITPQTGMGPNTWGYISGRVIGLANPKDYNIIIYSRAYDIDPNNKQLIWYIEPNMADRYITIGNNGYWQAKIHLGNRYGVLLVKSSCQLEPKYPKLPSAGGSVLIVKEIDPSN